jgi:hypothetical protein
MFPFFNRTRSACDSPDGSRDGNSGIDIGYLPDPMGMGISIIFYLWVGFVPNLS